MLYLPEKVPYKIKKEKEMNNAVFIKNNSDHKRKRMNNQIKVFKLNEYEWWAGTSLLKTLRECIRQYGVTIEEIYDKSEFKIQNLDDGRVWWDGYQIDDGETEEDKFWLKRMCRVSFRRAIELSLRDGQDPEIPFPIACTEW
ncbi:hypothetical protein JWG44_05600 [Leptospira sp. 201903071]|uniref:hypothetical protein n=1 Tax=Leptospira ainazelensis TaxID=2810034 RepID=UPI0019652536|nr:hypothetical protein [Leptospira ainazelensis]MBM9499724.1 hypothetical protein [Leptospira ainazelensis]